MLKQVSWLRRGRVKAKILEIVQEPRTPVDIAKTLNLHRESISRALIDMEKKGVVKCQTPEEPNFRYYQITKEGKKLLETFRKLSR